MNGCLTTQWLEKPIKKWRICTDFNDLNKVYPKDYFQLLRIDTVLDVIARHEILSFIDDVVVKSLDKAERINYI